MKKLMIAAFAVAFAAVAQAATVKWSVSNVDAYDATGTQIANGTANYTLAFFFSSDGSVADFTSGKVDLGTSLLVGTSGITGKGGLASLAGYKNADWDYENGYYYYAVLVNSTGTTSIDAFDHYAVSSVKGPGMPDADKLASATDTALSLSWTPAGAGYNTWETVSVPEPTSALMLLVGLAGLALKRKVA